MAAGYIYVLVNSSMPDLTKVGKTTKSPSERATELSGVTGVPTPFIVAFEEFFPDCDLAERCVHDELERLGLRQSDNREFFRAPANVVIKAIFQSHQAIAENANEANEFDENSDLIPARSEDDGLLLTGIRAKDPWSDILVQADAAFYGFGNEIQDYAAALKLYQSAARLGSALAYEKIGEIFRYGKGVRENTEKALDYYKEGAKRGNYFCWHEMADIFIYNGQIDNFKKCCERYFKNRKEHFSNEYEEFDGKHKSVAFHYIGNCLSKNITPEISFVVNDADDIASYIKENNERLYGGGVSMQAWISEIHSVQAWISENMQTPAYTSAPNTPNDSSNMGSIKPNCRAPISSKKWFWQR